MTVLQLHYSAACSSKFDTRHWSRFLVTWLCILTQRWSCLSFYPQHLETKKESRETIFWPLFPACSGLLCTVFIQSTWRLKGLRDCGVPLCYRPKATDNPHPRDSGMVLCSVYWAHEIQKKANFMFSVCLWFKRKINSYHKTDKIEIIVLHWTCQSAMCPQVTKLTLYLL